MDGTGRRNAGPIRSLQQLSLVSFQTVVLRGEFLEFAFSLIVFLSVCPFCEMLVSCLPAPCESDPAQVRLTACSRAGSGDCIIIVSIAIGSSA